MKRKTKQILSHACVLSDRGKGMEEMKLVWPVSPRVEIHDNKILIIFENGKTQIWGVEEDTPQRELVVNDIQEGLRAIKFLSTSFKAFVESSYAVLNEKGFSDDQNAEYLSGAIQSYFGEQHGLNFEKMSSSNNLTTLFYVH